MRAVPVLTNEQRLVAQQKAMQARMERAELKRALKAGEVTLADGLSDPRAQRIRVEEFLKSLPGIGRAKARRIRIAHGIAPNRRVGGLGVHQREALAEAVGEYKR